MGIAAQEAHADESLTLIDNTGDDGYQADYLTQEQVLGPGPGTLLTAASTAATGTPAAPGGRGGGHRREGLVRRARRAAVGR